MGLERDHRTSDISKKNEYYKARPWTICISLFPPFHNGGRAAGMWLQMGSILSRAFVLFSRLLLGTRSIHFLTQAGMWSSGVQFSLWTALDSWLGPEIFERASGNPLLMTDSTTQTPSPISLSLGHWCNPRLISPFSTLLLLTHSKQCCWIHLPKSPFKVMNAVSKVGKDSPLFPGEL